MTGVEAFRTIIVEHDFDDINPNPVKLSEVNAITEKLYQFSVKDWDDHREGAMLGKFTFDAKYLNIDEHTFDVREFSNNLEGKSVNQIAEIFNCIINKYKYIYNGKPCKVSLHLRTAKENTIPNEPFIFMMCNEEKIMEYFKRLNFEI